MASLTRRPERKNVTVEGRDRNPNTPMDKFRTLAKRLLRVSHDELKASEEHRSSVGIMRDYPEGH